MAHGVNRLVYNRQRFLLQFISQLSRKVTSTDLQKLVFLYTEEKRSSFYDFLPYKFGPYSFQLRHDLDILVKRGFIRTEDYGDSVLVESKFRNDNNVVFDIAVERGDALIKKSYRNYPYYAINSEITERLFDNEERILFQKERQKNLSNEKMLFTVGYEGMTIEAFMNKLLKNNVRLLCDVRKNSISRKYGFSKKMLEHITTSVGIDYLHISELGIDSSKRNALNSEDDYRELFLDYKNSLHSHKYNIERLCELLNKYTRIVLMCFESNPDFCHRHIIKDTLVSRSGIRSKDL